MATATAVEKGQQWATWIWIKWKQGAPEDVWGSWKNNTHIKGAWSTTGQWDAVLWIDDTDPAAVDKFVWHEIRNNKWVDHTETSWVKRWL